MVWNVAELAVNWANRLVDRLNERNLENALIESDRNLAFLRHELEKTSNIQIRSGLISLVEQQLKARMLAQSRQDFSFRVIEPAKTPLEITNPKPLFIITGGLLAGLLLGLAAALVKTAISDR